MRFGSHAGFLFWTLFPHDRYDTTLAFSRLHPLGVLSGRHFADLDLQFVYTTFLAFFYTGLPRCYAWFTWLFTSGISAVIA